MGLTDFVWLAVLLLLVLGVGVRGVWAPDLTKLCIVDGGLRVVRLFVQWCSVLLLRSSVLIVLDLLVTTSVVLLCLLGFLVIVRSMSLLMCYGLRCVRCVEILG